MASSSGASGSGSGSVSASVNKKIVRKNATGNRVMWEGNMVMKLKKKVEKSNVNIVRK